MQQGRNGLGNIYVWASGDGGEEDDCNCDVSILYRVANFPASVDTREWVGNFIYAKIRFIPNGKSTTFTIQIVLLTVNSGCGPEFQFNSIAAKVNDIISIRPKCILSL